MPSKKKFSLKKTHHAELNIDFNSCNISLLDENKPQLMINLKTNTLGSSLLDEVCLNIGKLIEKDYFGLRYMDKNEQKYWLKLDKTVVKQLKKAKTNTLYFSVKHYPGDPSVDLVEELALYQLYLQLRKDFYSECLIVNEELLPKLISLVIQAEMGDVLDPSPEIILSCVNSLKIVKNISKCMLDKVCEIVSTLNGLENKEMESQFIQIVSQLESYGVEPYCVYKQNHRKGGVFLNLKTDMSGQKTFLGMNHQGICTFFGEKRNCMYYWENISKMMFISKIFMLEINIDNSKRKLEFKFNSENAACAFWIWAMDRQYFMTLNTSSEARQVKSNSNIFRRKIKHRFSGRSKKEVTESCSTLSSISHPSVIRTRNPVTVSRSNSAKAVFRDSMIVEADENKPNTCSTLPRRSDAKKPSVVSIDFQKSNAEEEASINQISYEAVSLGSDSLNEKSINESEPENFEQNQIEEVIEPVESLEVQSIFSNLENYDEEIEPEIKFVDNEIRERRLESVSLNSKIKDQVSDAIDSSDDCSRIESEFHYHSTDGMFFVKFVVMTTLILLVVMVTSLVAYYYYRSASIADLKKQKYSSEWNKNLDLEAIKRFVLRNDAP